MERNKSDRSAKSSQQANPIKNATPKQIMLMIIGEPKACGWKE
jgi:hypothetical protein